MTALRTSFLIIVLALSALRVVQAADPQQPCKLPAYDARLDVRYTRAADREFACIAGQPVADRLAALRKEFYGNEKLTQAGPAVMLSAWPQVARNRLEQLQSAAATIPTAGSASFADAVARYKRALDQFVGDLAKLKSVDDWMAQGANTPAELLPDFWHPDSRVRDEPGGLPAKYLADQHCLAIEVPSDPCEAAFIRAAALADEIFLVDEIVSIMTSKQRSDFAAAAASREARWHSYLYDAQFQFWWELALNRYVEVRCPAWLRWDCDPPQTDTLGNELGFREPPHRKLMFLHPDVGIEYLNHEPPGQKLKPALIFQWFGFQNWGWEKDAVSGLKGIAIVTSVADTAKSKHIGYGLQLQWQKYALAVTAHGSYIGVTISRNLIDVAMSVNPKWAEKLKEPLPK